MGAVVHFLAGPLSAWFAAELTERALHLSGLVIRRSLLRTLLCSYSVFVRATYAARVYNSRRESNFGADCWKSSEACTT